MINNVFEGVLIAAVVGLVAYVCKLLLVARNDKRDIKKIHSWLVENSDVSSGGSSSWKTIDISSNVHLTPERVEELCHRYKEINLVTNSKETEWSLHYRRPPGFFDINWSDK